MNARCFLSRMLARPLLFAMALLATASLLPSSAYAAATASIDRDTVAMGDSLTLTISAEGNTFSSQPDFSALAKDFEISRGISRGSQVSIVNGRFSSKTNWQVTLMPRRAGTLTIPPLTVGNDQTNALAVKVRAASAAPGAPAGNDPVTLVATIDASRGLQRAQRILVLRGWFDGIGASDVNLEPPTSPDFQLVSLGDPTTFAQDRDGHHYQVIEARFAVFPLHTGRIVIPAAKLNAVIEGEERVQGFFRIPTQQRIRRLSSPIALDVDPVPVAGLPVADAVTIDTDWSTPPDSLHAGVPVTLTLTITAKGALPDAMPAADVVVPNTVRRYANPAKRDSSHGPEGLVTTVTSTVALIPQFGGRIDMPPIELRWWNAKEGHEQTASVALPPLIVSGAAAPASSPATTTAGGAAAASSGAASTATAATNFATLSWPPSPVVLAFIALLVVSLLANAVMGWLLWNRRERVPSPRALLRDVNDAIVAGDAARTRDALLVWLRRQPGGEEANSLDDVARLLPDRERGVAALEAALYGDADSTATKPSPGNWRQLLANITVKDLSSRGKRAKRDALPPLYPQGK